MIQSIRFFALWGVACSLSLLLGAPSASAQAQTGLPTYVRVKANTPARNFQDRQGLEVTTVKEGTLLQVHSKSQGAYPFYEVSQAGGFPVWVYGQFLDKTDTEGVLRVNADHINQRPRPSTDTGSMPLRTKLMLNDKVLLIKRSDENKAWDQDWIQIWSPNRTRAWVEVGQTEVVQDNAAAQSEWKAGLRAIPSGKSGGKSGGTTAQPEVGSTPSKAAPEVRPEAVKSLRYSDALFDQAIADKNVTLEQLNEVEAAYHRVLEMAPAGTSVREMALQQLEKLKMHQGMAELRQQMRQDEAAKQARMQQLAEQQRLEDLKRTASWGRFQARGWVEMETIEGEPHYYVRWEGERQSELACGSGRYDLSFYVGYQVGVQGSTRRAAMAPTLETAASLRLIDVARLEVIAGSAPLH
ncbi:MAG: hypothetical protein H6829_03775 [Planctomycetes bacterium]|nr:hypothetical protein [Planctomycetota bacterium]HPF14528.1 hypothetical protein [Planctomycetota bacterium]